MTWQPPSSPPEDHIGRPDACGSKEYLRRFDADGTLESERQLSREDLPSAQRLLAIFDTLEETLRSPAVVRGCPFHNAAVEAAGEMPEVARLTEQRKQAFRDRLAAVAASAGVADATALGRQLAVIYEGAAALAASCNDAHVADDARAAAATLLKAALHRPDGGGGQGPRSGD